MALRDALLPEFDREIGTTRRLLERVPPDYGWKPHWKSMSLGALATHLAHLPRWATITLDQAVFDLEATGPSPTEITSSEELLGRFDETSGAARRAIADKTDGELLASWTLYRGAHMMFTLPKIAVLRSFVMNHMIHHRGQLSVYLRMKDVPIPAIYGPSADEGS